MDIPFVRRGQGLGPWVATLLSHVGLVVLALAWVIVRYQPTSPPSEPDCFAVPAGGASPSASVSVQRERPRSVPVVRITSRSSESTLALPAPTDLSLGQTMALHGKTGVLGSGGLGGAGTGIAGLGPGLVGSGVGRVGRPVMGASIVARRLAVYLDCSGSMRPYLDRVETEIRRQFPDADVFRFDGARIVVVDGEVADGRGFDGHFGTAHPGQSDPAALTAQGRRLLGRIAKRCESGSLGAWIDWLLPEDYDGLVVFSDFQDGVRQYRRPKTGSPELIYADGKRRQVDVRREAEARWEKAWLGRFSEAAKGRGPRLYLFSIEVEPQPLLRQCAVASGGGVTMVEWLRSRPPR